MATTEQKKILLVEDETSLRELYRELLFSVGFEVDTAEDGKIALEKIRNNKYDLILLDIRLPEMDGLQVLHNLTDEEKSKNGKIYMLTNFSDDKIIRESYKSGASGYLMKSALNPDDVLHEVETALGE
jgi:DNA-binding response OmpR family regulator